MTKRYLIFEQTAHRSEVWDCADTTFCTVAWAEGVEEIGGESIPDDWLENKGVEKEPVALVFFGNSQGSLDSLTPEILRRLTKGSEQVCVWCHYGRQLGSGDISAHWNLKYDRLTDAAKTWISGQLAAMHLAKCPIPFSHGQTWPYDSRFKEAEESIRERRGGTALSTLDQAWKDAQDYFGSELELSTLHAALPLRMAAGMIVAELKRFHDQSVENRRALATGLVRSLDLKGVLNQMGHRIRELGIQGDPFGGLNGLRGVEIGDVGKFSDELEEFVSAYGERSRAAEEGIGGIEESRPLEGEVEKIAQAVAEIAKTVKDLRTTKSPRPESDV